MSYDEEIPDEALYRITSPYFCAGVIINTITDKCVEAAPIVRWMVGKYYATIYDYCQDKGLKLEYCSQKEENCELLSVEQ